MGQKNSFAETINTSNVMLSGLKRNVEHLSRRGLDNRFISELETTITETIYLNNLQENLKSKLKEKTQELNLKVDSLNKMLRESKTIVKLELEKESWKSFGIEAKR